MSERGVVPSRPSVQRRWAPNGEFAVACVLLLEIAVFSVVGDRFLSVGNAFELTRLAAEIGLLACGLTFVIKTGGIDLSVGSMMGLSAVVFGATWANGHWNVWLAAGLALAVGALGGWLNGFFVTRLRVPPLIVTLGTFSLYRGLAEAISGGYATYAGFPGAFLALGQGYAGHWVPIQILVCLPIVAGLWVWLHRTPFGRELSVIGYNPEGARFGGVKVATLTHRTYILCGTLAALAGLIYVARIGQAKADAGLGYELTSIAAVVLGGTAIAGGSGTLQGTLLGLLCFVVLQNGLRLAGQPSEIGSLATGAVLLVAVALNQRGFLRWRIRLPDSAGDPVEKPSSLSMKNSHVILLIAAILAGAFLIAGSNFYLAHAIVSRAAGPQARAAGPVPAAKRIVVAITPKGKADPYFVSCKAGAEEAAAELGVDLLWDAPVDPDPAKQNEIVEAWITKQVDVIAASSSSGEAISSVLRKARAHGIGVITWDSDALPDARSFFVNQATAKGIGSTLADEGARLADGKGEYAIITAELASSNQNEWIKYITARMAAAHPEMKLAVIRPCDGQRDKAMSETKAILRAYPKVKTILAICSPAMPGAAEALKQEGRPDVKITGLSTPNLCRDYVHDGWISSVVLWNTQDLGYLTVMAAAALRHGALSAGSTEVSAGRLGKISVVDDQVLLGKPMIFTTGNIDRFQF